MHKTIQLIISPHTTRIVRKTVIIRTKNSLQNPKVILRYQDPKHSFLNRNREKQRNQVTQKKTKILYHTPRYLKRTPTPQQSNNPNWRITKQEFTRRLQPKEGKNPLDRYGKTKKYATCHSINHWTQNLPEREKENTFIVNEVVLHQSHFKNPNELKNLTSETWSSALLHCATSKTV